MPWPTNPSEEYFGRGLWGWVTTAWVKLLATAGGALHVYVKGGDGAILVQQQQASLFTPGIHGYDGSAWRKLSLLWGYTDRWSEDLSCTATGSGYVLQKTTAVPAGYVYVLEAASLKLLQRATTWPSISADDGTVTVALNAAATLGANTWMFWDGRVTLKAGDQIVLYLSGMNAGDTFTGSVWGHKMAVT